METERSAEISALFDGELGEREAPGALRAARHDPSAWRAYSLIGASLRGEPVGTGDLTDRVMARLAEEPVVLAPRQLVAAPRRQHPLLALAASVAGVAVVGWIALTDRAPSPDGAWTQAAVREAAPAQSAAVPPAPTLVQAPQADGAQGDLHEYLLAHHAQAATVRLGDSAKQIRTVAMSSSHP